MIPQHSQAESRWRTPQRVVEMAREVLGGISLDAASDDDANQNIRAARFLSATDDALITPWDCFQENVFLNPPGGKRRNRSLAVLFWERLIEHRGDFNHAIFVGFTLEILRSTQSCEVPAISFPFCIPIQRLRFDHPDGRKVNSPTHANAIIYVPGLVDRTDKFIEVFSELGACRA